MEEKQAAVAIVLAGPDQRVLLIRRAENPADPWSGHMALPGGHRDVADADLLATALREVQEETGVTLSSDHLSSTLETVVALNDRPPPHPLVTPFVFRLDAIPPTEPNAEVAEIVWTPLDDLASGRFESRIRIVRRQSELWLPAWDLGGRIVWGLTHRILLELLRAERARRR